MLEKIETNYKIPTLKLNRETNTLEFIGFNNVDPNGAVTFTLLPSAVMVFAGVLHKPFDFSTTLSNGKCNDAKIFYLVDNWLEKGHGDTVYFTEWEKHYAELRKSYN